MTYRKNLTTFHVQEKVTYFPRRIDGSELAEYLDPKAPASACSASDSPRSIFYHYMVRPASLFLLPIVADAPRLPRRSRSETNLKPETRFELT